MSDADAQTIGRYRIIGMIDRGAQATVYRAEYTGDDNEQITRGTEVALKRLHTEDQYFERQSEFHETLLHKNIVRYIDHFRDDSTEELPCVVMEYLDGLTLQQAIEARGQQNGLPWEEVKEIFHQCLEGLIFAGEQDIVHRDIKPSNIFVTEDRVTKIIDFGVVRRLSVDTTTVGLRGTMDYMAPDFVTEDDFSGDQVSDIFSLGVCLFEALTGELPFEKLGGNAEFEYMNRWKDNALPVFSPSQWVRSHRKKQRARSDKLEELRLVLSGFSDFLKRCLSPDRKRRFKSFQEMQRALHRIEFVKLQSPENCYQFTGILGVGGFGRVYRARLAADYRRTFAIKHLLSSKNAPRFRREAELMQQFPHAHIVSCEELIENTRHGDDDMYLVMELLPGMPGSSLRDRLKRARERDQPIPVTEALSLFAGLLAGLDHLHRNGVLHRDIKPANLYAPEGHPEQGKLLDLGIARDPGSTMTKGGAPGTLDYMAPEFAIKSDFKGTPSSDVYSLGLTLYETLANQPAFPRLSTSTEPVEVAFFRRAQSLPKAGFEAKVWSEFPNLKRLVKRAIEPRASKRYSSAGEMLEDIRTLVADPNNTLVMPPGFETTIGGPGDRSHTAALPGVPPRKKASPRAATAPTPPPPKPQDKKRQARRPQREPTKHYPPAKPRQNADAHPPHLVQNTPRTISPSGNTKLIISLLSVLLIGVVLVLFTFQFMQSRKAKQCTDALANAHETLQALASRSTVDTAYLRQLLTTRLDMQISAVSCDKLDWSKVQHDLPALAQTIPATLRKQTIAAILSGDALAIDQQQSLWGELKRYGELKEFGLDYDSWQVERRQAQASNTYRKHIADLQSAQLGGQTNLTLQNVILIDELYGNASAFLKNDWSTVYAPVRNAGSEVEQGAKDFIQRVDAMFIDYIVNIGAEAVKKSRNGQPVIPEYQAITDPKLMTTTIGRESTAFREKRARIEELIKGLLAKEGNF